MSTWELGHHACLLQLALFCRKPIRLHYLGVSFGLTQQLYNFWQRAGYQPAYVRQSASDVTGEHTCVMLQALQHPEVQGTGWLEPFVTDFKARFTALLGGAFRTMGPALALSILNPKLVFSEAETAAGVQDGVIVTRGDGRQMSPYDLKRLQVQIRAQWYTCGNCVCAATLCKRVMQKASTTAQAASSWGKV